MPTELSDISNSFSCTESYLCLIKMDFGKSHKKHLQYSDYTNMVEKEVIE